MDPAVVGAHGAGVAAPLVCATPSLPGLAQGGSAREGLGPAPLAEDVPDTLLLTRLAAGDVATLDALYARYGGLAYGLAYRMLGDRGIAEDVVQDTFLAIWQNAATFDPSRGSARTWLLTTVRNRCIDLLRGPRRRASLEEGVEALLVTEAADDVWESVRRSLDRQAVRRAIERLPEEQQVTIRLAYLNGYTHAQIAAQMRVPLGTVKGRMRLALEKLRDALVTTTEVARFAN